MFRKCVGRRQRLLAVQFGLVVLSATIGYTLYTVWRVAVLCLEVALFGELHAVPKVGELDAAVRVEKHLSGTKAVPEAKPRLRC